MFCVCSVKGATASISLCNPVLYNCKIISENDIML